MKNVNKTTTWMWLVISFLGMLALLFFAGYLVGQYLGDGETELAVIHLVLLFGGISSFFVFFRSLKELRRDSAD